MQSASTLAPRLFISTLAVEAVVIGTVAFFWSGHPKTEHIVVPTPNNVAFAPMLPESVPVVPGEFVVSPSTTPPTTTNPGPEPDPDTVSRRATAGDATVDANANAVWSGISQSPGCWFFSGPAPIGRDHKHGTEARLTRRGDHVTLRFGTALFQGSVRKDNHVALVHADRMANDGWRYVESIRGTITDDKLTAQFRYRECQLNVNGRCTLGSGLSDHCAIRARVTVTLDETASATTVIDDD